MNDKPKKINKLTIRFDDNVLNNIKYQAEEENREISEFVRHCVLIYLKKIEEVRKYTL